MEIAELGFRVDTTGISKAGTELDKLGTKGDQVGKSAKKTGGLIDRSFRNSAGGIGVASSSLGILKGAMAGLGIGNAVAMANRFEASMNDVEEKLGGTAGEMEKLRQLSLEMGSSTAFSASQAADAMSSLAAKGLETNKIIAVLPDVLDLAAAAQLDLESSAKLTTATMNQFGIGVEESRRVVDLLASVGDSSAATIGGLASSLEKAGPAANAYGESLESTAAVIAILANNSIEAEVAGTAIAGMFSRLMIASGDGSDALAEIGLASSDFIKIAADGREEFVGYADAIEMLSDSGASATQVARIFGKEAGKNLVPLIAAGADAIRDMEASFGEASTASQQAATQMKGLPGAMKNVASAWEAVNLAFVGQDGANVLAAGLNLVADGMRYLAADIIPLLQPLIRGLVDTFSSARQSFVEFRESMRDSTAWPVQLLRDMSAALSKIGEYIAPVIPYLDDFGVAAIAIGGAAAGVSIIAGALAAVAAVVLSPVVLGVATVAAGAILLREHWEPIAEWWSGVWSGIQSKAEAFLNWWNGSTIDEKRAKIKADSIEFIRDQYDRFLTAWNDGALLEKAASIKDSAITNALEAGKRLSAWWDSFELEIKTPNIDINALDIAKKASELFVSGWNNLSLVGKIFPITADPLDTALAGAKSLKSWWDTSTFEQKALDVTAAPLKIAESVGNAFINSWGESDLKTLVMNVDIGRFNGARDSVAEFASDVIGEWSSMTSELSNSAFGEAIKTTVEALALSVVKIIKDLVDRAIQTFPEISAGFKEAIADILVIINDFAKVWEAWFPTIKAIAVVGWGLITAAFDIAWAGTVAAIRIAWDLLTGTFDVLFKLLQGDFVGAWFAISETIVQFGSNLVEGFKGIAPAILGAINDMAATVKGAFSSWVGDMSAEIGNIPIIGGLLMKKNAKEIEIAATDIGMNGALGVAKGLKGHAGAANDEASTLASNVLGTLKGVFKTRSPSKETEAIGAFVTQGLTAGMGFEAENLYSFTRQMSGVVLDELGNMADAANDELALLGDGLNTVVKIGFDIDAAQFNEVKSFIASAKESASIGRSSSRGVDLDSGFDAANAQASAIQDATEKSAVLAEIERSYQSQLTEIVRSGEATRAQFKEASFSDQLAGTINKYSKELSLAGGFADALFGLDVQKKQERAAESLTEAKDLAQAAADAQAIYEASGTEETRILAETAAQKASIAEAAARSDFESQKKAQLAQARVSQGLAIMNAFASGGNFITGLALAATAAAVTQKQINSIKSQQFNGGSSLTAAPSAAASGSTAASSSSATTSEESQGQTVQIVNLNGMFAQTDTDTIVQQSLKKAADAGLILDSNKEPLNTQNISVRTVAA